MAIQYLDDPVGVVPPAPEEEQLTFQQKLKKIADNPPRDLTLAERAATSAPGRAILGIAERMGGNPISRGIAQSPALAATTASDLYLGATQKTYEAIGAEDAAKEVEGVRRKAQGIAQDWEQFHARQDKQFAGGETAARILRGASSTIIDALTAGGVMSKLGNASKGNSLMMQYYATRATQEAIQKNPDDWQNAIAHGLIDGLSTGLGEYVGVPTSALAGTAKSSTNRLMARAVARVKDRVPLPEAAIRGVFGSAVETGSEVLTETANYFADVAAGIEKLDWGKFGKRLAETAATAGLTGAAATSVQPVVDAMRQRHEMTQQLFSDEVKSKHNDILRREVELGIKKLPPVDAGTFTELFHGSPHEFDKFDLSKVGTGEGVQKLGHGIYFSDYQQIAELYKTAGTTKKDGGNLYRVGLKPKPEQFITWHKPISEQSTYVRRLVEKSQFFKEGDTGGAFFERLKKEIGEKEASAKLAEIGIPGVIYDTSVLPDLPPDSPTPGVYLLFDPDAAAILSRNDEAAADLPSWITQDAENFESRISFYLQQSAAFKNLGLEKQLFDLAVREQRVQKLEQEIDRYTTPTSAAQRELKKALGERRIEQIGQGEKAVENTPAGEVDFDRVRNAPLRAGDTKPEAIQQALVSDEQVRQQSVDSELTYLNDMERELSRIKQSIRESGHATPGQMAGLMSATPRTMTPNLLRDLVTDGENISATIAERLAQMAERYTEPQMVDPSLISPRTRAQRRTEAKARKLAADRKRRVDNALEYYEATKDSLPTTQRKLLKDAAKAVRTPNQLKKWMARVDVAQAKLDRKLAKDSLAAAMDKAARYATRPEDRSAVDTILSQVDTSDKKVREQAQVLVDWVAANPNAAVPAGYEQALKQLVVQPEQPKQEASTKPSDFRTFVDEDGRKQFKSEEVARLAFLQQRVLHKAGLAPEATDLRGDSFKTELAETKRAWWAEDADDRAAKKQLGDEIEKMGGRWKDRTGQNVGTIDGKTVLIDTSDAGLVPDHLLSEMESELIQRGELPAKPGSSKRHVSELSSIELREMAEAIEAIAARAAATDTFQTMATDATRAEYAQNVVSQIIQKRPTDSGLTGEVISTAANIVFRPETIMASLSEDLRVLAWENIGIEGHRNYLSFSQSLLDDMNTLLRSVGLAPDRVVGATGQGGSALNVWRYEQRSIGGVPMTRAEAAHLYALSLDPEARSILAEGGATLQKARKLRKKAQHVAINDGTLREIGDFLGAEGRRIVEHGFGRINTTMRDAVNAQWLVQYNAPLSMRNDYFPIRRDGDWVMENKSVETFMADMEQTVKDSYGEFGITKRREADLKTAVEIGDFFDVYSRHIDTTARIHGYMGPVRDFHAVYSKAEVKQAIVNKTSNAVYEGLLEAVKQQVLPVRDRDAFSAVARKLVHGSGAAILGLRIVTPFKNSLGLIAAQAQYAGGEAMLAAATAKAADPRNLERMEALLQTHSPVWRQRTGAYLNEATSGVGIDSRAFQPAGIADATLFHVSAADKFAGIVRGFMAEDYVQNTLGIDPKDARFNTEVAKEWERLLARTESTSIGLEMSGAQRAGKRHGVVASLTQFGSGASKTMSLLQSGRNDIRDGQYKRGVRKFAAFGTTAITDAVIGAMFAATAAGKEEELIDRVAGSLARLIPAVGEYVNQAYRYVRGKKVFSGPQDTLQTVAIDGLMGTADLYKAVESYLTGGLDDEGNPEYQEHAKKAAGRLSLLVGSITKLPTEGAADIYKRMANGLGIEGEERESLAKIVSDFTKATDISEPRGKIRAAIKTNDDALFLEAIEEIHSSAPKKLTQRTMEDAVNGLFRDVEKFEKNPQLLLRLTDSELRTLRYATEQRAAMRSTLRDMLERNLGQIEKIVGVKQ